MSKNNDKEQHLLYTAVGYQQDTTNIFMQTLQYDQVFGSHRLLGVFYPNENVDIMDYQSLRNRSDMDWNKKPHLAIHHFSFNQSTALCKYLNYPGYFGCISEPFLASDQYVPLHANLVDELIGIKLMPGQSIAECQWYTGCNHVILFVDLLGLIHSAVVPEDRQHFFKNVLDRYQLQYDPDNLIDQVCVYWEFVLRHYIKFIQQFPNKTMVIHSDRVAHDPSNVVEAVYDHMKIKPPTDLKAQVTKKSKFHSKNGAEFSIVDQYRKMLQRQIVSNQLIATNSDIIDDTLIRCKGLVDYVLNHPIRIM